MAEKTTTRFGVDITDLKKGMQDATQIIKLTNSEFKNATAGMDDWSSSADGLSAKVKQLSTIEEQQQKKLEILREEYRRVVEAQGENSVGARTLATEINNQEAVVKSTHKELQNYNDKLDKSKQIADNVAKGINNAGTSINNFIKGSIKNGVSSLADGLKSAGKIGVEAIGGLAKSISVGLAGAVAVGIASITKIGSECKQAYEEVYEGTENLILATGATGETAKELEDSYKSVASSINADFGAVGSAMGEVNTRFGYTGEQLEDCTTQFLKFAEITGTDATSAVQLVSRAMGDAGIDADDYSKVLDELAIACQGSGISLDTLATNLTKYGAPMRALGFDTEESIAIFSSWEKAGVNTEIAFSGMKKAISNWSAEGKDARKEFKKTLKEIENCPDIASATTKAIEVFGSKAGPDLADAIQCGRFEYEDFLELLQGSDDTVSKTFNEIQTGADKFETATNRLKVQGAEVGEVITEVGGNLASSFMGSLSDIIDKLLEHKDTIKKVIDETIVPKLEEFRGKVSEVVGNIVDKLPSIITKVTELKEKLQNAIGTYVVPILGKFQDKVKEITPQVIAKVGEMKDKFLEVKDNIVSFVQTYILPILTKFKESGTKIFEAIKNAIKDTDEPLVNLSDVFHNNIEPILSVVRDIVAGLVDVLGNIITWIIDNKEEVTGFIIAVGAGFLTWNAVSLIQGLFTALSALPSILTVVKGAMAGLNAVISANPIGILITILVALIAYFVHLYNTSEDFRTQCDILWAKIKEIAGKIKDKAKEIWDFFVGFGEYLYDWIHVTIPNKLNELKENIANFIGNIIGKFTSMKDDIFNAGQNLVEGLWNGIGDKFNWVTNKISDFCGNVMDNIKNFFGIHSPSKLFETDIGYNLVYGLANGITKKTSTAVKSMTDLAKATVSPFSDLQANIGVAKNNLSSGLSSSGGGSSGSGSSGGTTLNFYQTNTSPKSLSRLEIYRQTKNQLNFAKAVI